MPINSRQKGSAGEREWRDFLKEHGFEARRTQQYAGFTGDASDVICEALKEYHWEVKRTEAFHLDVYMTQAVNDSKKKKRIPVVAHRKNRGEWRCVLRAEDLLMLLQKIYEQDRAKEEVPNP